MNDIEGKISIQLHHQPDQGCRVDIRSSRPVLASKVFIGKQPEQALSLLPLMFNICGHAQARTAVAAMQSSLHRPLDNRLEAARDMLVLVENAREHMFRVFVDWPKLFKTPVDSLALHALGSMIPGFRNALFKDGNSCTLDSQLTVDSKALLALISGIEHQLSEYVFKQPSSDWLALQNIDELDDWCHDSDSIAAVCTKSIRDSGWSAAGATAFQALPPLDENTLISRLDADDADAFIAQPDWQQSLYETTPLSRHADHPLIRSATAQFGHSLLARWLARLVELASTPPRLHTLMAQLDDPSSRPQQTSNGNGLAMTEAARGRLIHRVQIDGDSISNYQILAPTEWNFHPQGLVGQSLANLQAPDNEQLDRLARLLINTIDPCVGYDLTITGGDSGDA